MQLPTRISQHEMTPPTVGDDKLHIDSPQLSKKNYVQRILYGRNVNFERSYKFYNLQYIMMFAAKNTHYIKKWFK